MLSLPCYCFGFFRFGNRCHFKFVSGQGVKYAGLSVTYFLWNLNNRLCCSFIVIYCTFISARVPGIDKRICEKANISTVPAEGVLTQLNSRLT
jgi:hypothetical protein